MFGLELVNFVANGIIDWAGLYYKLSEEWIASRGERGIDLVQYRDYFGDK